MDRWSYEQIVRATMKGEIVPPIQTFENQGAAAERARLRKAVEAMLKEIDYCNDNGGYWLDKVLSLLKDGDEDE